MSGVGLACANMEKEKKFFETFTVENDKIAASEAWFVHRARMPFAERIFSGDTLSGQTQETDAAQRRLVMKGLLPGCAK